MSLLRYGARFLQGKGKACQVILVPRRWKKTKKKWHVPHTQRKMEPSFNALKHFDDNYRHQFGDAWPSIRLGLLSSQKYGALINNYCLVEETEELMKKLGAKDFVQPVAEELEKMNIQDMMEEDSSISDSEHTDLDSNQVLEDSSSLFQEHTDINRIDSENLTRQETMFADKQSSLEEQYIVAPGYEAKMEFLLSSDAIRNTELNTSVVPETEIKRIQKPLSISKHLRCFIPEDINTARFPASKMDSHGVFLQYYAMDAASVLPVIALGISPGDVVLDMCAAPGGKSLAITQTMFIGGLVANEPESSRRRRLKSVLRSYIGFDESNLDVRITAEDGCEWGTMEPDTYDKVLVDVPCTTDRLSASNNTNSIFAVNRTNERWQLPKLQSDLLCAGLQAVKPGGDVIYSTCSLSNQQNDAVVESALYQCQTDLNIEVAVVDLSPLTQCLGHIFHFSDNIRHGQLVLPNLKNNFGPMYFCKLHRVA
ncbi:5-cytosine rRNA methyltransferase NSUN4-like isoform X2 [Asterias amurensis]|uniref:5-cytosine rRNA methyltransferase NSUN4-like isoform X2 n=2 Tax=Asterias amurensis TaxID=7602 RepID=UPI003AB7743F